MNQTELLDPHVRVFGRRGSAPWVGTSCPSMSLTEVLFQQDPSVYEEG